MNKVIFTIILCIFFIGCSNTKRDYGGMSNFDKEIYKRLESASKPGLAAIVVESGKIVSEKYYGNKNIEKNESVDRDTVFNLASISKTFVAIAVMQQVEKGRIELDDDINKYLKFKVRNPYYRGEIITMRMLLTHTSTIDNNWFWVFNWIIKEGDPKISLSEFVEGYLVEGGKYYHKENFVKARPSKSHFQYSNPAICLAAYIVEKVSGENIEDYMKDNIFIPLEMENTSFFYKYIEKNRVAMPYDAILGFYIAKGLYSAPFYPSGFLKSSARDMGNFMIMISKDGVFKDKKILGKDYFEKMISMQENVIPDDWDGQGLVFQHKKIEGHTFVGHTGGLWGIATMMYYDKKEDRGVILLMNGGWKNMFDGNRMNEKEIKDIFFMMYSSSIV